MLKSGERAYVYAKACGIIGKSFVGKRLSRLSGLSRLADLDRLVFPGGRELPERELLVDLERRIIDRTVKQIITLIGSFAKPPRLLEELLRSYEYADLKGALRSLGEGESKIPDFTDLGPFQRVKFQAYPDLAAMLKATEFEFLLRDIGENVKSAGEIEIQTKLDRYYYTRLWDALISLPRRDREGIGKILGEEISLRNSIWALRLRTYYGMNPDEVCARLVSPEIGKGREKRYEGKSFLDDALASLKLPLDNRAAWSKWKRVNMLNRDSEGWRLDPRYFQNAASQYLYRLTRTFFRRRPFSLDTACCFIKLKQFEEDLLTSVAEGLGLGLPGGDIFALMEFQS
ncbi:MAG: V-type ATPase subunit [Treponema sp.]|jgi:vacuolar-type H+-ATPase subunit C/Vma6|nr:V-type ATPase subunit [Treponema sp.]